MIGAVWRFAHMMPVRLRAIKQLLTDPVLSRSYYPDEPRKSKYWQLLDNLWWLFRYQEVNYEYLYYGMDRINGPANREYLAKNEFRKLRDMSNDRANAVATRGDSRNRGLNYRMILGDKFTFDRFLNGVGIPTPSLLALGDSKSVLWFDTDQRLPLSSLLEREVDGFWKDALADGGGRVFSIQSGGGTLLIDGQEESLTSFNDRIEIGGHFIIQERLQQHPNVSELYDSSINTIRLVTMVQEGEPRPFAAIIRLGAHGTERDNFSTGGIAIDIDIETGRLGKYGFIAPKFGTRTEHHPDTGMVFEGFNVPYFFEAVQAALKLHSFFYGFHSIGWDVAITPSGPSFLEGNDDWGLRSLQGPHGGLRDKFLSMLEVER
jgi:Sugar-transfer associated ATP-grasp